jgi:hypothetical protein
MQDPTAPGPRRHALTRQEALRTLELAPEVAQVRRAELSVDESGMIVDTNTAYGCRTFSWEEIERQSRAQPQPTPWMDPVALTQWTVLLRVIGQLLDERDLPGCIIAVQVATPEDPQSCRVCVTDRGQTVFDEEAVRLQVLRRRSQRGESPPAVEPSRRPWWMPWRRD